MAAWYFGTYYTGEREYFVEPAHPLSFILQTQIMEVCEWSKMRLLAYLIVVHVHLTLTASHNFCCLLSPSIIYLNCKQLESD